MRKSIGLQITTSKIKINLLSNGQEDIGNQKWTIGMRNNLNNSMKSKRKREKYKN